MSLKPLRVLLAHNFYRTGAPSGEDAVFRNERQLLETNGIEVISFERHNDDIEDHTLRQRLDVAFTTIWSKSTYEAISDLIKHTRPDIAHFHNTFPQISPSAYLACKRHGVPVVQTLHNFRLICPGALLQRNGVPCEDCVGANLLPALRHRCYRGSFTATAALTSMLVFNRARGSYQNNVNTYIALTKFAASRLKAGGIPADRITIKPNFLPDAPIPGTGKGGYAVYVGRLSSEKGVRTMLKAWRKLPTIPLKILGDGPLMDELTETVHKEKLDIEFLGFQPRERILKVISNASVQIVPSEWYEGFPMVILEAFACGTPIVASRIGSLEEIVSEGITGTLFNPGDADELAAQVTKVMGDSDKLLGMRVKTRDYFDKFYAPENNLAQLETIYKNTIKPGT